jgi:hypothetical protein
MSISTMEALAAMPVGSSIRVDSPSHGGWTFQRTEQGWVRDGTAVPVEYFSGYVKTGVVSDAASVAPRQGDWYQSTRYWYWIRAQADDNGLVRAVRWHRTNTDAMTPVVDLYSVETFMTDRRVRRIPDPPPQVLTVATLSWFIQQWEADSALLDQARKERESIVEERNILKNRPEPAQLQQALVGVDAALMALRQLVGGDSA